MLFLSSGKGMWNQTRPAMKRHPWPKNPFVTQSTFCLHVKACREVRWKELVERPSKSENKSLIGHLFPSTWVCGGRLWSSEKWRKRSRDVGHCYTQSLCTHTHTHMHDLSNVSIQMVFNLPPTQTNACIHTRSYIFLFSQSIHFSNRPLTQISFHPKHTTMSCTDPTLLTRTHTCTRTHTHTRTHAHTHTHTPHTHTHTHTHTHAHEHAHTHTQSSSPEDKAYC